MSAVVAHLLYALAWLSFAAGHSVLAAPRGRAWLEGRFGDRHRLVYNAVAVVHLAAVVGVGWAVLGGAPGFHRPGWLVAAQAAVLAAGLALGAVAARDYDLGRLAGTRPDRMATPEPLNVTGLHRWVRHPLYAAGLLILWGVATDPPGVATAVWGSLYLVIGSRFEERRLLRLYGTAYATYRARVPAFVPWRGPVTVSPEPEGARS